VKNKFKLNIFGTIKASCIIYSPDDAAKYIELILIMLLFRIVLYIVSLLLRSTVDDHSGYQVWVSMYKEERDHLLLYYEWSFTTFNFKLVTTFRCEFLSDIYYK
jgi:hypothetical protein